MHNAAGSAADFFPPVVYSEYLIAPAEPQKLLIINVLDFAFDKLQDLDGR